MGQQPSPEEMARRDELIDQAIRKPMGFVKPADSKLPSEPGKGKFAVDI